MSDSIQIKIIATEKSTHPTQKGSYDSLEITYKNLTFQDKVESKKVVSFNHKQVFATLAAAPTGAVFTIQRAKNDKGYWDWIGVGDDAPQQTSTTTTGGKTLASPKSTYETPEERAKKQVYIVRQSSINAAIETLKNAKGNPSVNEVLAVAKQYEIYVFGAEPNAGLQAAMPEMPDDDEDVPY
jgi:hypothetical protein